MPNIDFTSAQINHRLSLIDENKNLLQYPYKSTLPYGLTDVGDGSILTSSAYSKKQGAQITTHDLPAGKYIASLAITDIKENPSMVSGFALKVTENGNTHTTNTPYNDEKIYVTFTLDSNSTITVSLDIPDNVILGLLIKPQIEKYTASGMPSDWVPNMDKIGTYVDRRFNGTNAKIKVLTDTKAEKEHVHNYAGSDSAGGAATSANKVNNSLIVKFNNGTNEGMDLFTFDGSAGKYIDITPESIGAMRQGDSAPPIDHDHGSNDIIMTGYTTANAISAIKTTDSLNEAIGKLEKILEDFISDETKRNKLLGLLECIETIEL